MRRSPGARCSRTGRRGVPTESARPALRPSGLRPAGCATAEFALPAAAGRKRGPLTGSGRGGAAVLALPPGRPRITGAAELRRRARPCGAQRVGEAVGSCGNALGARVETLRVGFHIVFAPVLVRRGVPQGHCYVFHSALRFRNLIVKADHGAFRLGSTAKPIRQILYRHLTSYYETQLLLIINMQLSKKIWKAERLHYHS